METNVTRSYSGWKFTRIKVSVRKDGEARSAPTSRMLNASESPIGSTGSGTAVTWVGPGVPKFGGSQSRRVAVLVGVCVAEDVALGALGKNGDGVAERLAWDGSGRVQPTWSIAKAKRMLHERRVFMEGAILSLTRRDLDQTKIDRTPDFIYSVACTMLAHAAPQR